MAYFGTAYEIQTTPSKARKYLSGQELPPIGCERDFMIKKCDFGFVHRLMILNVSGQLYVASSSIERKELANFFGFKLESQE